MYTDDANRPEADDAELTPAERELAGGLRGLSPAAPRWLDRDATLFEAGRAAASRSLFRWRMTAAAAAVLAAAAGAMFAARMDRPQVVREVVYVDRAVPTPPPPPTKISEPTRTEVAAAIGHDTFATPLLLATADPAGGLFLRDRALRWGVSAAMSTSGRRSAVDSRHASRINVNELLDDGAAADAPPDTQPSGESPKTPLLHREQL